jgi:phage tail tape-measure protein
MHETVKLRLQQQYDAIKQEGAFTDMADTKLRDMPGKLATDAKQMYNTAKTAVGNTIGPPLVKAATAVGNTTPREIQQGIGKAVGDTAAIAATGINNAVKPLSKLATDAKQMYNNAAAGVTPAGQPDIARESTDFARVKHLTKILNG